MEQTPAPEEAVAVPAGDLAAKPSKEGKDKVKKIVIIVILILLLLLGAMIICLLTTGKSITTMFTSLTSTGTEQTSTESEGTEESESEDEENEEEGATEEEEEQQEEESSEFNGDYVSATLPKGWTITEYFDGDGSTMMVDGVSYTGLTGITVANPAGDVVFKLEAVNGIGGTPSCPEYYKFADSDSNYYNQVVATSANYGVVPTVVDLSSETYSAYTFFGKSVRRVDTDIYWDTTTGGTTFDAACGLDHYVWTIGSLSFVSYGTTAHSYQFEITTGTSSSDLTVLDSILQSF